MFQLSHTFTKCCESCRSVAARSDCADELVIVIGLIFGGLDCVGSGPTLYQVVGCWAERCVRHVLPRLGEWQRALAQTSSASPPDTFKQLKNYSFMQTRMLGL